MTEPPLRVQVSPERLELPDEPAHLDLVLPPEAGPLRLVIDLYEGARPVSHHSHLGAWVRPAEGLSKATLRLDPSVRGEARVRMVPGDFARYRFELPREDPLPDHVDVHVILRDPETKRLLVDRVVPWLRTPGARDAMLERQARLFAAPRYVRALAAAPALGPDACVHVVARDLRPGDAVGNLTLDVARWLRHRDVAVQLWAQHFDGYANGPVRDVGGLPERARPGDLVFYQHSIGDPYLETVLAAPSAKLCFYHGVTPPELIPPSDRATAESCRIGLAQLPRLAGFDGLLAASSFTAAQLADAVGDRQPVGICPPMLNADRFDELPAEPVALPEARRLLLYVGRLAPHKGVHELVDAFAAYLGLDPDCALVLAGPDADVHGDALKERIQASAAGRAFLVDRPSDGQLKTLYEACTAYVSMSAHEGFGIPLVEAMGFGKPVLACESAAVRETLGGAGLFDRGGPRPVAAAWHRVLGDPVECERVVGAQAARCAELRRAADGSVLAEAMERARRTARTS